MNEMNFNNSLKNKTKHTNDILIHTKGDRNKKDEFLKQTNNVHRIYKSVKAYKCTTPTNN